MTFSDLPEDTDQTSYAGLAARTENLDDVMAAIRSLAAKATHSRYNACGSIFNEKIVADRIQRHENAHGNTEYQTTRHMGDESLWLLKTLAGAVQIRETTDERIHVRQFANPIAQDLFMRKF